MKDRSPKPDWSRLSKSLLSAELQFKKAQHQVKQTEAKSRLTRHRHKQAKETARLAKKEAKRSKAAFREAECLLEEAETKLTKARKEIVEAKERQKGSKPQNGSTLHLQVRKKSRMWKRAAAKSRKKPLGQEQIALADRPLAKTQVETPAASPLPSSRIPRPVPLPVQ
jgi:hypothetical protein